VLSPANSPAKKHPTAKKYRTAMQLENRLIVGCGYLGQRVATTWLASGHRVFATTRSSEKASQLAKQGIKPLLMDVSRGWTLQPEESSSRPFDAVLFALGFDRQDGRSIEGIYRSALQTVLAALSPVPPKKLIYISSTGVYGDVGGDWVDEDSPCNPTRDGGKACLVAERLLALPPWSERSLILRLAGIYGPGRLPRKADLVAGKPIASSDGGYLNLIHVADAVQAIELALEKAIPPRTYIVSDGAPVVRGDYYREVARQLGAPEPRFDPNSPSSRNARSGAAKRVSNARISRELHFVPRFPSYREGIAAALNERE
jgi:nucleoside-diphosphate-sugar epimerase